MGFDEHRSRARQSLWVAFLITLAFLVVELVGAWITGSLALLADAGHMLTDASSLGLALFATWFSARTATTRRSYGWHRVEILAAFLNGLALVALSMFIAAEAIDRFKSPPQIQGGLMLGIAAVGLAANLTSGLVLFRSSSENLNVKGAFLHVLADMLGSVGALVAGLLIFTRGWMLADPVISILIGILVLVSSWTLIHESVSILLESTPHHIDSDLLTADILAVPGVLQAHDLHVWTMTSGYILLTVHVVARDDMPADGLLHHINEMFQQEWGITHTTVQIEYTNREHKEHQH